MARQLEFSRENVRYVLVGCLTSAVNLSVYFVSNWAFSVNYLVSNIAAWVVTVLFAYVANKLVVFRTHCRSLRGLLHEFAMFLNSRLFSGVVDQLLMWMMVGFCCYNSSVIKIVSSVVAVTINYFVSRKIFKQKHKKKEGSE